MNQYSPYGLSGSVMLIALDILKKCPIVSRIFPRSVWRGEDAINVSWDIVTGSAGIMRALDVHSPASVGAHATEKTVLAQLPRFKEVRPVDAATLLLTRKIGDRTRAGRRMKEKIAIEHADLGSKFARTLSYMAAQSLKGAISLIGPTGSARTVATWGLPAAHTPDRFTGEAAWTHDNSDPKQDVLDQKTLIMQETRSHVEMWYLYAGSNVISAATKNKSLKGDGKRLKLREVAEELEVDSIIHYSHTYEDEDKTWVPMIGKDEYILVGWSSTFYELIYMRLNDLIGLSAEMDGNSDMDGMSDRDVDRLIVMSDAVLKRDPRVMDVSVEGYVLPVCRAPGSTVVAKPVAEA